MDTRQPPGGAGSAGLVRRRLLAVLALGAPGVLGACGKKGQLRLPERSAPPSSAPPASASPASSGPEPSDEETK